MRSLIAASVVLLFSAHSAATSIGPFVIFFDSGNDRLQPQAIAVMDALVSVLEANPMPYVMIEGHSDSLGHSQANRRLSCRRARAAAAYLLSKGIAPQRLGIQGYGEDRPWYAVSDIDPEATNRRVEFVFRPPEEIASAPASSNAC